MTTSNRLEAHLTPKVILSACVVLTLAYAIFSIHGFSLAYWHFLDQSPEDEVLFGKAQGVRNDDWDVWLPFSFSQIKHDPPFALVNETVGLGQNMALIVSAPIADPIIFFRPYTWGYFVGPDFGMGWCWGVYVFGFIAAFYLLFMELSGGRSALSLAAAVAILFSPFFQFWGLNSAFLAASLAACVVAAHRALFSTRRRATYLYGIGLGWSAGAFLLALYPPFQVVMGYFGLFTLLGLVLRSLKQGRTIRWNRDQTFGLVAALLLVGFASGRLLQIATDAIEITQGTIYPGQRFASGGAATLWQVFSNNVFPHYFVRESPTFGDTICEAASFILLSPLILFLLCRKPHRSALVTDPLLLSLFAFTALLMVWNLFGFPEYLARFTLLSKAPEARTVIGFGVADVALVVAFLSSSRTSEIRFSSRAGIAVFLALVLSLLIALLLVIASHEKDVLQSGALLQVSALIVAQLVIAFLLTRKRQSALFVFAAVNVVSTGWFNPVVQGGYEYIWNNPVSAKIRELDATRDGHSSWIILDDMMLGQLPPMLGVRSLTGVQFYPQMQIWSVLDPQRRQEHGYNRFAHVVFHLLDTPFEPRIGSPAPEVTFVEIHPDDPKLLALPFDYVIQPGNPPASLTRSKHYRHIFSSGNLQFFERTRHPPSGGRRDDP